ncbi:ATP-dependent DNA helicase RRM3-like [Aphis craccivora]|uniref:ATP-dependent DNA helicase RRM3-like n=1 Tax=Aphis craccivora TaxID=307492 RepID=A0A6G0YAD4_APHCR|nr:ATP-dependent DNA helicase RRM3-like [Aphis craccivora]
MISLFTTINPNFPIRVSFAMTINKSQGQSFKIEGIDLSDDCFIHGQFYVACSRISSPTTYKLSHSCTKRKNNQCSLLGAYNKISIVGQAGATSGKENGFLTIKNCRANSGDSLANSCEWRAKSWYSQNPKIRKISILGRAGATSGKENGFLNRAGATYVLLIIILPKKHNMLLILYMSLLKHVHCPRIYLNGLYAMKFIITRLDWGDDKLSNDI